MDGERLHSAAITHATSRHHPDGQTSRCSDWPSAASASLPQWRCPPSAEAGSTIGVRRSWDNLVEACPFGVRTRRDETRRVGSGRRGPNRSIGQRLLGCSRPLLCRSATAAHSHQRAACGADRSSLLQAKGDARQAARVAGHGPRGNSNRSRTTCEAGTAVAGCGSVRGTTVISHSLACALCHVCIQPHSPSTTARTANHRPRAAALYPQAPGDSCGDCFLIAFVAMSAVGAGVQGAGQRNQEATVWVGGLDDNLNEGRHHTDEQKLWHATRDRRHCCCCAVDSNVLTCCCFTFFRLSACRCALCRAALRALH